MLPTVSLRRLLEWSIAFITVAVLSGTFAWKYYVLSESMGAAKLQLAYHAMSQAMIQGKLACLRMSSQRCEEAWSPQNHVVVEQLHISMAYGYPTAFHDGIVLLAGLDNRYYRYRHEFSDLLVYPLNLPEARQRRCHIRYIQAASATQGPSMEIELSSC